MALTLNLNDQQEHELREFLEEQFINCKNDDDSVLFLDKLHKIGLVNFVKEFVDNVKCEENFRFVNMCYNRYDL